ncbi:rhomboid family intramembrane serine protease [Pedobacter immunditicola]|uniref:rhomboid family intramembrane serine protease n=1 Tax=Pedobacter immunditicola TaxID=3133440 RepID=UPI003094AFB0
MNKTLFEDLKYKVLHSGNPIFLYIGINTFIFVLVAFITVAIFLSGNSAAGLQAFINEYFAFPVALEKLPYRFYTIITYQFFHSGVFHLLFNMLWLYWLGRIFLDFLKPRQFHFVYLAGGIAGAVLFSLAFHLFPVFEKNIAEASVIGSSGAVMAIVVATATLMPNFTIRLLFLGDVKLKYLALAYVVLDIIGVASVNAGGSFAHLGGAVLGFSYIKALKSGYDWSNIFKRKPKAPNMKVNKNENYKRSSSSSKADVVAQAEIDAILDKISKSGYDKLSKEEKETLFKASKH